MKFGMARQQGWHGQSEEKPRHGEVRTVSSVRGEQGQGKGGVVERCACALGIAAARRNGAWLGTASGRRWVHTRSAWPRRGAAAV